MKRLILILMLLCSPLYMSIKMNKDILFGLLNVLCMLGWCLSWAWFCRRSKVLSFVWTFLLALTIFALLCSSQLWAACAASSSGAWTTGGNWTGCAGSGGVPASTDAVTVGIGFSMTCNGACVAKTLTTAGTGNITVQSGGTLTVNNGATNGSIVMAGTGTLEIQSGGTLTAGSGGTSSNIYDVTVGAGTTFKVDAGATFHMKGGVSVAALGSSTMAGHTICEPGNTTTKFIWKGVGSSADNTTITFGGSDYVTNYAVYETVAGQGVGGNCQITNGGSNNSKLVLSNLIINNCGDTSNDCITETVQTQPMSISIANVMLLHSGKLALTTNSGVSNATTFDINGVDIRNQNAASGVVILLSSTNATPQSGTRSIKNLTINKESASSVLQVQVQGQGFTFGSAVRAGDAIDSTGIIGFNLQPVFGGSANAVNQTMRSSFLALDSSTAGLFVFNTDALQTDRFTDSIFYYHNSNAQGIGGTTSRSGSANTYSYNFIDGDGYVSGDSGTYCELLNTPICNYNISVNQNLNPLDGAGSTAVGMTEEHLTSYGQSASFFGETSGIATSMTSLQYNLFAYPTTVYNGSTCTIYNSGFGMGANGFSQTGMTIDHNGYWGMQNSGDPGAGTCTVGTGTGGANGLLIYSSYLVLPSAIRGTQSNKSATAGTSGTTLVCSTCSFQQAGELAVIPGDYVYKTTTATWSTVASITNGTTLVMNDTNAGIASGQAFDVRKAYNNPGAIYGAAGFGANDIHAQIMFQNPGAGVCDYYNWIGAGPLTCTHSGTATDTNILAISHAFLAINGWDYGSASSLTGTNCAANCPAAATPTANLTPAQAMAWLRTQYTQYDGVYKNLDQRGSPYADAGATLTYPAAVIQ